MRRLSVPLVVLLMLCGGSCAPHDSQAASETEAQGGHGAQTRPPNRLARESSPYLLLHAHNPVDWHPWGPEALGRAKKEAKPIFLSIGYSSCYWCHVMERLVFQNEEIARYMNEHFINVKVDREERPDIDDIYMTALEVYFQAIGSEQGGGWPLSMFLTPEGKPFAGGTYFPPETQEGRMGFPGVLKLVVSQWTERRQEIERNADVLTGEVRRLMKPQLVLEPVTMDRELLSLVTQALLDSYDAKHGGLDFNPAEPDGPKFPVPAKLAFLQYEARRGNRAAQEALEHTLLAMARGGIYDHLGGGFHRYSTDREWDVPHFEKMLYDQAQLADVYVQAYRRTNDRRFLEAAEGVFGFVLREMTDPAGGFYSALDAETDGVEGEYYLWTTEQVDEILGPDAAAFKQAYAMTQPPKLEHGHVLRLPAPPGESAASVNAGEGELAGRLAAMRGKLFAARRLRPPLLRDDKVLASWNGLMIRALANSGKALNRAEYTQAAEKAALFVLTEMRNEQGQLLRTWRGGEAKLNAYLDDYAFLIEGLLALHDATAEEKWLNAARRLMDHQIELYWDGAGKGFYFTSHGHEELIARTKNAYDAVIPAGNSVSVRNLIRLASLTDDDKYRQYAKETLDVFVPGLKRLPRAGATLALAVGEYLDEPGFAARAEAQDSPEQPALATDPAGAAQPILQAAAESPAAKDGRPEIVTARAYLNVDKLPAGGSCRVVLLIEIQEGWHINANAPGPKALIPTVFSIESKQGVKLANVDYPAGDEMRTDAFEEPVRTYEKRVALYGVLTVPADAASAVDEMELRLRYQPCNDQTCLAPKTIKLKGRIPIAPPGEQVREINGKLFPKRSSR